VVVDRLKVRDDIALRLAESFETALRHADGIALVAFMEPGPDGRNRPDQIFSARYACSHCGYSLAELEPRLFSFNNPAGACPSCDGLGVKQYFDAERVITDRDLSLSEGAIRGWDKRNIYYFGMLEALAAHYGFDVDTPWKKLPKKVQNAILNGSGREEIAFYYYNDRGRKVIREHSFEGVLPNMERRYRETESSNVREELAQYLNHTVCADCHGSRLKREARHVFIEDRALPDIVKMPILRSCDYFGALSLPGKRGEIADKILKEIRERLQFLVNVGLDYLSLDRSAETLSGGEAQRIRLASQIGAGLVGVMYVLDEPSIGLHQRDNERLLGTLVRLRDLGNTVLVVEHDEDAIRAADHVVDIGPGAGVHGGRIVAQGSFDDIVANPDSLTGAYLSGRKRIEVPSTRRPFDKKKVLTLNGARGNNLKNVTAEIPLGLMTCVTGVSGSGKSTLVNATLYPVAAKALNGATVLDEAEHDGIDGLEQLDKVVDIDQSPIGRTPRSNPATYTGIFTPIRELFAGTQEARSRGYGPGASRST